jgi:hypothetical protein
MLLRRPVLEAIAAGAVTVVFRRWDRPRVRPGGTQRTAVGVLEFTSVELVDETALTEDDARAAGFAELDALLKAQVGDGRLYRIRLRPAGPDPRVELRSRADLTVCLPRRPMIATTSPTSALLRARIRDVDWINVVGSGSQ